MGSPILPKASQSCRNRQNKTGSRLAALDDLSMLHKQKSPAIAAGLLIFKTASNRTPRLAIGMRASLILVGRSRIELRDHAFQRLESLLGEIGIEPRDLLRFGHEGLIGGLRVFGLHFDRLVQRLHAGQLLDE